MKSELQEVREALEMAEHEPFDSVRRTGCHTRRSSIDGQRKDEPNRTCKIGAALAIVRGWESRAETCYRILEEDGTPMVYPFGLAGLADNLYIVRTEAEAVDTLAKLKMVGCVGERVLVIPVYAR